MTINERHFIGFIRFALMGGDYPRGMLTRASWQEQRRLAKEQTVSGLLYQTVTQLPQELRPPQQILMKLYSKVVYYENMNQLLNERTLEIFKKYREIGLHPILLKGPAAATLYEHPEQRVFGDIDIYVPDSQNRLYDWATQNAESVSYAPGKEHLLSFHWRGATIENHLCLLKFYNKTLELYDPVTKHYGKPYIREAWQAAGLVDDMTTVTKRNKDGELYTPQIWRVEFTIRSSVRKWFCIELDGKRRNKQSIRNTLDMYNSKPKLLILFASLADHYFHFKHLIKRYKFYEEGHSSGYALRKDRCPDKLLFRWKDTQTFYESEKEHVSGNNKPDRSNTRLLGMLKEFRDRTLDREVKASASVIIAYLEDNIARHDIANNLTRADIQALRLALAQHIKHPHLDPAKLIQMAKEELALRDEIDPFF